MEGPLLGLAPILCLYTIILFIYICIYFFNIIFIYLFLTSSQSTFHFPHFCGCTNSPFPGRHDYSLEIFAARLRALIYQAVVMFARCVRSQVRVVDFRG